MKEPGFWIREGVFSGEECDRILDLLQIHRQGRQGGAGERNLMAIPAIHQIVNDPRLVELGEQITGTKLIPYKATLFAKTGKANWLVAFHQDTSLPIIAFVEKEGWGPMAVKQGVTFAHAPTEALERILAIRIQLDDSTNSNGPLRVIPSSHHRRWLTDRDFDKALKSHDPFDCMTLRGGAVAMSPLILHASSKALTDEPRRVLHIEYADSLDIAPGIRLAIA